MEGWSRVVEVEGGNGELGGMLERPVRRPTVALVHWSVVTVVWSARARRRGHVVLAWDVKGVAGLQHQRRVDCIFGD